jgi:hypothetical protein
LASALPAPEQAEGFTISLPVGNWIVFYSFVIDHEIPFAYERPPPRAVDHDFPLSRIQIAPVL